MATHYEILGAPPHATHDELRRAYHRQARRHHPDARPGADADAIERARLRMARINAAWAVLGDTGRRRAYDTQIGVVARPSPSPAPPPPDLDDEDPFVLDDDLEDVGPRGPADLFVFVPVGLLLLAVATFAVSVLSQSPTLEWAAVILLPFTALAFVITPLFVLFARARARAKT